MIRRIVCITGLISQPRFVKRVQTLCEAGFEVIVVGYERGGYNCNALPENITFINKGTQKNAGAYLSKIKSGYMDVKGLIDKYGNKETLFYSFSLLTALWFYMRKASYIYEISDILYGYNRMKLVQPIMRKIDKLVIKHSALTIMTSQGFKQYILGKKEVNNVIVQPNKVNVKLSVKKRTVFNANKKLNFSFVGAIRYFDTVLRFAKIIGQNYPQYTFHFFGDSSFAQAFKNECKDFDNVLFHGKFKNPEDLESIYSQTDIVIACYEHKNLNERIAEPNKMYEAMLFCKPIVVSENTFLAEQVRKNECGYVINAYSDNDINSFIKNLTIDSINKISQKELLIPESSLKDNPQVIIDYIKKL